MQTYHVRLESDVFKTFLCTRAADALDINVKEKSIHDLKIECDIENPYHIGLILGASGSGKTTLCHEIWGEDIFQSYLDPKQPVIDQFPKDFTYEDCAKRLAGIGLTSVPCWIRPAYTLSNGQKCRAEAALAMCKKRI